MDPNGTKVFDCSHHQGAINWDRVVADGYDGVIMKITEGSTYVDPRWSGYHDAVGQAGLARGAYHFADLGNPDVEAMHFVTVLASATWELLPVGDIEKPGSTGAWTREWMAAVRRRIANPWLRIYSSYSLLTNAMNPEGWYDAHASIWAARYHSTLGWDHAGLELWQYTDAADIPGVPGHADAEAACHGWHIGVDLARMGITAPPAKPAPPVNPAPHPVTGKLPHGTLLREGSHGPAVAALQRTLNVQYPAYSHLTVDGDYGPKTEAVVREFQQRSHIAADGIAGPVTLHLLHLL